VQRIEAVRLSRSGTRVKLTLRASSVSKAYIDRIYISRPNPTGDPYDSAADLTLVSIANAWPPGSLIIAAGTDMTIPENVYNLDEGQPLLVAVDFSAVPPSGIRCTKAVPTEQACAYYKKRPTDPSGTTLLSEAANANRIGFTQYPGIYLIEKIEISTG
jgi:hypothetical protein